MRGNDGTGAWRRALLALLCLVYAAAALAFEESGPRYALVIGNADYREAPLENAANDAADMAEALEKLDYRVTLELNLEAGKFVDVVRRFYEKIEADNAVSIFYYAGHAIQLENTNYLVPVNSGIDDLDSLQKNAFVLDKLLYIIKQSASAQNVIILDACRDNPFEYLDAGGGLAPVEAPANTLVAYATEPGNVSSDGSGRNGVYTAALLKHIEQAIPAEQLFRKVRNDVMRATGKRQVPWEHSSLTKKFFFGPPATDDVSDIVSF